MVEDFNQGFATGDLWMRLVFFEPWDLRIVEITLRVLGISIFFTIIIKYGVSRNKIIVPMIVIMKNGLVVIIINSSNLLSLLI